MTETAQRKGGGKPFHSILEPHFDFIRELRQRRKTWQEITKLLLTEKGIRVTVLCPISLLPAQIETRRKTELGKRGK